MKRQCGIVALVIFVVALRCKSVAGTCRQPYCGRNSRSNRPNIIFFLVDDMGWNDVGFHGLTQIPTPNIDTLAYNSIILNNYYTQPACSPSRSALLSGKYATSLGLQHIVIDDTQRVGLPLELRTMPNFLKDLGYRTHMLGKWHLGFYKKEFTPEYRGFDSFTGFWNGDTDHFLHYSTGNRSADFLDGIPCYIPKEEMNITGLSSRCDQRTFNEPGKYLTTLYTERAVKIINRHRKNKPLFLYLAHHGVHRGNFFLPVRAPRPLTDLFTNIQNETRKNFAGAMTAIDQSMGDLMEALSKKNMLDNTILVFSSDNGSPVPSTSETTGGSNYPLRGVKVTAWEGGVRNSAFVWAKKLTNKGTKYNGLMHIVDWLPTLYSAAGGNGDQVTKRYNMDAIDHWNAIINNLPSPRKNVVLQNDTMYNLKAYISGDMKIVLQGHVAEPLDPNVYYGEDGRGPPPADFPKGSKTEKILSQFSDFKATGTPIIVDCGTGTVNFCDTNKFCLYNLTADPCERTNLADEQPDVVSRLEAELIKATENDPPINYPNGEYAANPVLYDGFWASWVDKNIDYVGRDCDAPQK